MYKMKIFIKSIFIGITLCFCTLTVTAQTIVWSLQPTNYNKITCINNNLYKVIHNGKVGLINADGTIVAEVNNDELSKFHDEKAILTRSDEQGELIVGCLLSSGNFYKFPKKYYTLTGQNFYSDDVISVKDEKGKLGYVDCKGNAVVGFDGKYSRIKPFVEGFAAVFKNKTYFLINKDGDPVNFRLEEIGEVNAGTNVYKGNAIVWDTDGTFYSYNSTTDGVCKKIKKPKATSVDYLYRLTEITGMTRNIPFEDKPYEGRKGLSPIENNGLYGFQEGDVVIPCQFAMASQLQDRKSIVALNGKLGIISYISDASFSSSLPKDQFEFDPGDKLKIALNLDVPAVWKEKSIDVILKDESGNTLTYEKDAESYTFEWKPQKTETHNISLTVSGEGLLLYETSFSFTCNKIKRCPECKQRIENCKYKGNHPKEEVEEKCPDCKLPISKCQYGGVH